MVRRRGSSRRVTKMKHGTLRFRKQKTIPPVSKPFFGRMRLIFFLICALLLITIVIFGSDYTVYHLGFLNRNFVTHEELELYFYVSCGVTAFCIILFSILIGVLFVKVNRLAMDDSNQLGRQANMMAEFCYTNPTIVPGEELSRRGFSMYSGSDNFIDEYGLRSNKYAGSHHETRSKF